MKLSKTIPNPLADRCQRLLFSIAFVASCTIGAIGQSLVTEISSTTANLTSQEALAFQTLQQDTFTKNVKLVSFGNPTDFMDNGEMTFTLPGIEGTIVAKVIDIVQTDTSMGWVGRLTNQNGFLAIHETHGLRGAWIQAGHRFFEIMPIKEGVNTLREINGDIGDAVDCIAPEIGPSERSVDFCAEDYNTCGASIDILVLVPQDVRDWLVSRLGYNPFIIAIYVALGTYSINAAFINSDIPNKQVNIMYEAFNYVYPPLPLNCNIGLNGSPPYQGLSSQAAGRRVATGADLVVLLTSRDFPCGAGAAVGNPSDGGQPAFALVEINWLIHPRWTFPHEVGHLLSARHSRSSPGPGDDDSSDCGHGWTVDANRFQRTLMAPWFGTAIPTDIRVLHFSNPTVDYPLGSGDPSGTPYERQCKVHQECSLFRWQLHERLPSSAHQRASLGLLQ